MEKREVVIVIIVFLVFGGLALWLLGGGWDYMFIEIVYVDANYEELVIDRPANTIHLTISGNGNDVTVTGGTLLKELNIYGNENTVRLCDGVHDPLVDNGGEENEIIFSVC
ncbi:MAG: DUF3060 domain-containing protein [archaeon]